MIIGVPKEIKEGEKRVGMIPQGVDALVAHGHRVLVEREAGEGSGFSDEEYREAGATLVQREEDVWVEGQGALGARNYPDEARSDPLYLSSSGC